jgi:hypothetical protein
MNPALAAEGAHFIPSRLFPQAVKSRPEKKQEFFRSLFSRATLAED